MTVSDVLLITVVAAFVRGMGVTKYWHGGIHVADCVLLAILAVAGVAVSGPAIIVTQVVRGRTAAFTAGEIVWCILGGLNLAAMGAVAFAKPHHEFGYLLGLGMICGCPAVVLGCSAAVIVGRTTVRRPVPWSERVGCAVCVAETACIAGAIAAAIA